jgi:hypothetical protein
MEVSGSGYPLDWEFKSIISSDAVTHLRLTRSMSREESFVRDEPSETLQSDDVANLQWKVALLSCRASDTTVTDTNNLRYLETYFWSEH